MKYAVYNHKLVSAEFATLHLMYKCPFCGKRVVCHNATHHRKAYFSHVLSINSFNNPGETTEHIMGKQQLAKFFDVADNKVIIENYLSQINQWPDLMVNNTIVEFQCSPISTKKLTERISGYSKLGLKSWWILGGPYQKRYLRPTYIARFLNYSVKLGFFMLFWKIKQNCLEIRYGISEKGGRISYHVKRLYTFFAFKRFIQQDQLKSKYINQSRLKSLIISEMAINRRRLFHSDITLMKLQQMVSQHHNTVIGCPIVCHVPAVDMPIFNNRVLLWRILIILLINKYSDLRVIYQQVNLRLELPLKFCQIKRYQFLYKRAFIKYIRLLTVNHYIKVDSQYKKITKLKEPRWFNSYYDKLHYLKLY